MVSTNDAAANTGESDLTRRAREVIAGFDPNKSKSSGPLWTRWGIKGLDAKYIRSGHRLNDLPVDDLVARLIAEGGR